MSTEPRSVATRDDEEEMRGTPPLLFVVVLLAWAAVVYGRYFLGYLR